MSEKFRLGFTGTAKTLVALMSRLLPDDLEVEMQEIVAHPAPRSLPKIAQQVARIVKPRHARAPRTGNKLNPHAGVNKILLDMLADGKPHHVAEADGMVKEAGYSPNGMYSRILRLEKHGYVFQPKKGLWQLAKKEV